MTTGDIEVLVEVSTIVVVGGVTVTVRFFDTVFVEVVVDGSRVTVTFCFCVTVSVNEIYEMEIDN